MSQGDSGRRKLVRDIAVLGLGGSLVGLLSIEPGAKLIGSVWGDTNIFPPTGNVGIGTTFPGYALQIVSGTTGPLTAQSSPPGSAPNSFIVENLTPGNSKSQFTFKANGVNRWSFGNDAEGSGNQNFFIYDEIAASIRLFVDSGGKIGVGTTNPQHTIDVVGDVGQTASAGGLVKAAALVNGNASIIRSFNKLPGGNGPTVSQPLGLGTYEVNFGVNVAQRFFLATLLSSNSTDPGGAADGQILVSTRDGNSNAVFVRTNDTTGTSTNRSFYLMIF